MRDRSLGWSAIVSVPARIVDRSISYSQYSQHHQKNRPEAILPSLLGIVKEEEKQVETFTSGDDFMAAWKALGGK